MTYSTTRGAWTDGTYSPAAVARELTEALRCLRAAEVDAARDEVAEAIDRAARAAGPGKLAERLGCLRDCLQAELAGEDPAAEHDYRAEVTSELRDLAELA